MNKQLWEIAKETVIRTHKLTKAKRGNKLVKEQLKLRDKLIYYIKVIDRCL